MWTLRELGSHTGAGYQIHCQEQRQEQSNQAEQHLESDW